jgi:hypothetical protein
MYGDKEGVAILARVWTIDGEWVNADEDYDIRGTNPPLSQVTDWLTELSDTFDTALASNGFITPVTETKSVSAIGLMVEQYTAKLCHLSNGIGDPDLLGAIQKDITTWVTKNAAGLEANGAERSLTSPTMDIRTKDTHPIFARSGFGNRFDNWNND